MSWGYQRSGRETGGATSELGEPFDRLEDHRECAEKHIFDFVGVQTAEQFPRVHNRIGHRIRLAERAQATRRESRSNKSTRSSTLMFLTRRIMSIRDASLGSACRGGSSVFGAEGSVRTESIVPAFARGS
jgi:hypothetical protein